MKQYTARVADHNTDLVMTDLSSPQCTHAHWYRDGWRKTGRGYLQKVQCARCGIRRTIGGRDSREIVLRTLAAHYKSGLSIKRASTASGYAFWTVQKVYKLFRSIHQIMCGCGRPSGHSGWCQARRLMNPEQAYRVGRSSRRVT